MPSLWCRHLADFGPAPVGLMADSHGDSGAIAAAVAALRGRGCQTIIHLGDIVDSCEPATAAACVARLTGPGILAVCGNNDHALLAESPDALAPETRRWLAALPLTIQTPAAVFAHNRPDVDRLGTSALFGDLSDRETAAFLRASPGRLLFRGHSHLARIRRPGAAGLETLAPPAEPGIAVAGGAVITCGSLEKNTALVWEPSSGRVYRIGLGDAWRLREPGESFIVA